MSKSSFSSASTSTFSDSFFTYALLSICTSHPVRFPPATVPLICRHPQATIHYVFLPPPSRLLNLRISFPSNPHPLHQFLGLTSSLPSLIHPSYPFFSPPLTCPPSSPPLYIQSLCQLLCLHALLSHPLFRFQYTYKRSSPPSSSIHL